MSTQGTTFETGAEVEKHGVYVCAPCGYKKTLETGDTFPECDSCMRNKTEEAEADPDDVPEPSGVWEYVGASDNDAGDGDGEDDGENKEDNDHMNEDNE